MPNFPKSKGFQLKSGNKSPFKEMGSIELMKKVDVEKLDTPKLSDKPIETTKTFEETSAEIKAEKKAEKKAARKQKMKEIGKGLKTAGEAISRAYGKRGTGSIMTALSNMKQTKEAQKSQNILDRTRQLSNEQKIEEYEQGLSDEGKMPETNKAHVDKSGNPALDPTAITSAERYADGNDSYTTPEDMLKKSRNNGI